MLALQFNILDAAGPAVRAMIAALEDLAPLNASVAFGAEAAQKDHLERNYEPRSRRGWWGQVKESVEAHAVGDGAELRIPERGAALRFYGSGGLPGGAVRPGKSISSKTGKPTRSLAVALDDAAPPSPGNYSGPLAFIPSKRPKVAGVLVQAVMEQVTSGPNKGKMRAVPMDGAKAMYALMLETVHRPDPGVVDMEGIGAASLAAAAEYVAAAAEKGGAA